MSESQKNIVGGMDTGGGVGFGIPSDWGGGVRDGEPDPVIAEHNEKAKSEFDEILLPPKTKTSYKVLASKYAQLPETSNVRKRAEDFERRYSKSYDRYHLATEKWNKQKAIAYTLLPIANKIAGEAQSKMNEWTKTANEGGLDSVVVPDYKKFTRTWHNDVVKLIKSQDIRLWDVSKSMSGAFGMIASVDIDTENPFTGDYKFDAIVKNLDDSVAELERVGSEGGGEILDEFKSAAIEHETDVKELQRMESELNKAITNVDGKSNRKSASRKYYRFIDENDDALAAAGDEIGIPNRVPNYKLAMETSPRVCGSCRFFKWDGESEKGDCVAFDFQAKANYTCDAWQAVSLTTSHTTVRDEGDKMYSRKDADSDWKEPVYYSDVREKDGTPKEIQGQVSGERLSATDVEDAQIEVAEDFNYSLPKEPDENYALRAAEQEFLPSDVVFSKSANSIAVVTGSVNMGGLKLYSLKLVDGNGVSYGSAFSYGNDLKPRSKSAMKSKRRSYRRRMKSDDPQDVVVVTRDIYRALQAVVEEHEDLKSSPLSNEDVLNQLEDDIKTALEDPMFKNVTTGPKRKYYRAVQDSLYSIGAARQILFKASKAIMMLSYKNAGTPSQKYNLMMDAQKSAMDRVKLALKKVEDSLTLPSATHGFPAPGFKKMSVKDISDKVFDIISSKISHDNIDVLNDGLPLGEYTYTVHKYVKQGGMEKALDALSKLLVQINKMNEEQNLDIHITGSKTSELEGNAGYVATVTFDVIVVI